MSTTPMLITITDVYNEIRGALGEFASDFNIPAIADAFNPVTPFWAAVEANPNTTKA